MISSRISSSYGGGSGSSRTPAPPAARARGAASRGLCAVVLDRAGGIDRAQNEENVRLIEERERELAPEIAGSRVRRIAPALDLVREQELHAAAERPLHLTRTRALGKRGKTPDEPRVSPRAGLVAVDPARGVELLRIADEPLHERLEPPVRAVPRERAIADDVSAETRRALILLAY